MCVCVCVCVYFYWSKLSNQGFFELLSLLFLNSRVWYSLLVIAVAFFASLFFDFVLCFIAKKTKVLLVSI